ncbi:hypothetical protein [Streptomyces sp. NPDC054883]
MLNGWCLAQAPFGSLSHQVDLIEPSGPTQKTSRWPFRWETVLIPVAPSVFGAIVCQVPGRIGWIFVTARAKGLPVKRSSQTVVIARTQRVLA